MKSNVVRGAEKGARLQAPLEASQRKLASPICLLNQCPRTWKPLYTEVPADGTRKGGLPCHGLVV